MGDRVGIPWLAHTCGVCRFCTTARENLCVAPRFTGWDVNGGYAELMPAHDSQLFKVPDSVPDELAVFADPFAVSLHAVRNSASSSSRAAISVSGTKRPPNSPNRPSPVGGCDGKRIQQNVVFGSGAS